VWKSRGWRRGVEFRLAEETLVAFLGMSFVCGSETKHDEYMEEPAAACVAS
jgi:hypothetical protein